MENDLILVDVEDDEYYLNSIPRGYVFEPTDDELIVYYLMRKINNQKLPCNKINTANIYECSPDDLVASGNYKSYNGDVWYFFSPRNKKYKGGTRPDRAAGDGFWKATETNRKIVLNDETIGYRRTLKYLSGKHSEGVKTGWTMHEFTVKHPPAPVRSTQDSMRLDDCILCRLSKKDDIDSTDTNTSEEAKSNTEQAMGDEVPLTISFDDGEHFLIDETPPLLNDLFIDHSNNNFGVSMDVAPLRSSNDQVGMIDGPNNIFGVLSDVDPMMSSTDQHGHIYGPTVMSPRPQYQNPENGFNSGGHFQYSMDSTPTLIAPQEAQQNLRANGSSMHNLGSHFQYLMNPRPTLIARRSQHYEVPWNWDGE